MTKEHGHTRKSAHEPGAAPKVRKPSPADGLRISSEALQQMPLTSFTGPIHIIEDERGVQEAMRVLEKEPAVGFDTESRPSFTRGVSYPTSLLQLSSTNDSFIFKLSRLDGFKELQPLFANPRIVKAGIALADDLRKLREKYHFEPKGFVDVGLWARELGFHQTGIRSLSGLLLGVRVSKREQRSNWARPNLSRSQLVYAATDAWMSLQIYLKLAELRETIEEDGTNG